MEGWFTKKGIGKAVSDVNSLAPKSRGARAPHVWFWGLGVEFGILGPRV